VAGRRAAPPPRTRISSRAVRHGPAVACLVIALAGGSWFGLTVARSGRASAPRAAAGSPPSVSALAAAAAAAPVRPPVVSAPARPPAAAARSRPGTGPAALVGWARALGVKVSIPPVALAAYGSAQLAVGAQSPGCHLSWTTLAGIGEVESLHGTYGGAQLLADGRSSRRIIGVAVDGAPGLATIRDTDAGRLDGDPHWDRAVGPMQFMPGTWRCWARDSEGDGRADPFDVDDAALSAAGYLCAAGGDLSTGRGWTAAIRAYNDSDRYLADVWQAAEHYARRAGG
jgi:membrane-bound lytic murein transglycosylase B